MWLCWQIYFDGHIDDAKYSGQLFGMGATLNSHYANGPPNYRGGTPQPASYSGANNSASGSGLAGSKGADNN